MFRHSSIMALSLALACGSAFAQSDAERKALAALRIQDGMYTVDAASPGRPVKSIVLYETHAFPDAAVASLKNLPNLESIQFYSCTIPAGLMEKLNDLPKLKALNINGGKTKPEVFLEFGKLEKLEDLYVWHDAYDNAALTGLKGCKKLAALEVKMSKGVTDKGLLVLKDLPALAKIRIDSRTPGEVTVASLKLFKGLKYLDLPPSNTPAADLNALQALKNLETLKVTSVLDTAAVKALAGFPALQNLKLEGGSLTDEQLSLLKTLKTLKSINVTSKELTGVGFKDLKSLERIRIFCPALTDAGIGAIASLPELKSLGLGSGEIQAITPKGLAKLNKAAKLEELVLGGGYITDAAMVEFKELKGLKRIVLMFAKNVTDQSLKAMADFPNLEQLTIFASGATRGGIAGLQKAKPKMKIEQSARTGIDFEY